MDEKRFAVGECATIGGLEEMIEVDTRHFGEGASEFVAFAVVAVEANGEEGSNAEGDEIIEDRAGGTGLAADTGDVVDDEIGFDRDFGAGGVDFEIAIEADIAEHGDFELGIVTGDGEESPGIHD